MWKTAVRRECYSNVMKKMWDQKGLNILSKQRQLCTLASDISPNVESTKKLHVLEEEKKMNWFLYLNLASKLCRINITKFCDSKELRCKVVHDYFPGHINPEANPDETIPTKMQPVTVGSKVYMYDYYHYDCDHCPTFKVYSFDPTEHPCFRLCEGPISRRIEELIEPKPSYDDFESLERTMFSIDGKIYFLATEYFLVFDTVDQSWKALPPPPRDLTGDYPKSSSFEFVCGRKFFIERNCSCVFDTDEEIWEKVESDIFSSEKVKSDVISSEKIESYRLGSFAFIEYEGFLIGVIARPDFGWDSRNRVFAYRLDGNGMPNPESYHVLHDIDFEGRYGGTYSVLGKCDDGRIWLLINIKRDFGDMLLVVFRVSISTDPEDGSKQALSLDIKARWTLSFEGSHTYEHRNPCTSAFAMCHDLDKIYQATVAKVLSEETY